MQKILDKLIAALQAARNALPEKPGWDARTLVPVIIAVLAVFGVSFGLYEATSGGNPPSEETFTVGGQHGTPTKTITVPEAAIQSAEEGLDTHEKLRSEQPDGVTPEELDAAEAQQEEFVKSDELPNVTPDAAPNQRGCTTQLVQNYSSRRGVAPRLFVLHYTVSSNRPGLSDVNAIVGLFDRPSFSASSNYVIDNEGNCKYIVRESDKAWTQAAANPVAISVEQINNGHEGSYAGVAGLRKLALVASDSMRRWKIPVQLGAVRGCTVVRPGLLDHLSLGSCGGGHHDISPYKIGPVLAAIKSVRTTSVTPLVPPKKLPNKKANALCTIENLESRLGLPRDGHVDGKTRKAIKKIQRTYGLKQTGYAGKNVGKALRLKGCKV